MLSLFCASTTPQALGVIVIVLVIARLTHAKDMLKRWGIDGATY